MQASYSGRQPRLLFFIGTEAELIKVFPVVLEAEALGLPLGIIASGQNDIAASPIMQQVLERRPDAVLSQEKDITKSAPGLLKWFLATYKSAPAALRRQLPEVDFARSVFVVHGDTVSTVMGAWTGQKLGARVAHIEAGLRSHHMLNPFPEEIDRLLVSRKATLHFAPGEAAARNLKNKRLVLNTQYNTIYDSLQYALGANLPNPLGEEAAHPYFVLVLHRQENLMNRKFLLAVVHQATLVAKQYRCVFIMHRPTEIALEEAGVLDTLRQNPGFALLPRQPFLQFVPLLNGASFVITDGGSNQEELHYMGKPCLVLRKATERMEGLSSNAQLYGGRTGRISEFALEFTRFQRPGIKASASPSARIALALKKALAAQAALA